MRHRALDREQGGLDLRREDVDAADDEHVVAAAADALHAADRASARARLGDEGGQVVRPVADHRHRALAQRGEHQFALGAVGQQLAGLRVHDLRVEVVLENVQPGLVRALDGHTRADDLREAVDVVRLDAAVRLDVPAHRLGPGLRAENARAQRQLLDVHAQFAGPLDQVDEVAGRAADGGDVEVLHDHDLPVGVAAGDRDDRRAERLRAVMRAEAAGEQAVAVRVLDDVAGMQPAGGETAHHHARPDVHVLLRVGDDDRLARRPARSVQADHFLHRTGEQAERVRVAQVRLLHERQPRDIPERLQVVRLDPALVHPLAVEGDAVMGAPHAALEPAQLQVAQLGRREIIQRAGRVKPRGRRGDVSCHRVFLIKAIATSPRTSRFGTPARSSRATSRRRNTVLGRQRVELPGHRVA